MEILCETKNPVYSNMRKVAVKPDGSDEWKVVYMSAAFLDKIEAVVKEQKKVTN